MDYASITFLQKGFLEETSEEAYNYLFTYHEKTPRPRRFLHRYHYRQGKVQYSGSRRTTVPTVKMVYRCEVAVYIDRIGAIFQLEGVARLFEIPGNPFASKEARLIIHICVDMKFRYFHLLLPLLPDTTFGEPLAKVCRKIQGTLMYGYIPFNHVLYTMFLWTKIHSSSDLVLEYNYI